MQRFISRRIRVVGAVLALLTVIVMAPAQHVAAQEAPAGELTVVMTEMPPFVFNDDGRAKGFYAEIWDEVAANLDVQYTIVWVDSFADLLPAIAGGRADIAVAPLAPTAEREASFDFSSAVISSGPQLAFSDRFDIRPSLLRSLFDTRVIVLFAVAVFGLLILAHVIWLFERNRHDDDGDFDHSYFRGIWDGFWWSTVTATTVGYGDKAPKSFGGRLIALFAMLSSLVLVGAFVSQVTAIMAEDQDGEPIAALEDVDEPIGVVAGSSFAQYLLERGADITEYESQSELFEAFTDDTVGAVVSNPYALAALESSVRIRIVDGVLYEEFETFGLAQDSPWREPINMVLADMQSSGEIAEIIKDGLN